MSSLIVLQGVRTVYTADGFAVLIDEEDREKVNRYRWSTSKHSHGRRYAYEHRAKTRTMKSWCLMMHRLIVDAPDDLLVDHRNGDTRDNRKSNLRLCTNAQNQHNQRAIRGKSRYKGVSKNVDCNSWRGCILVNGKRHVRSFREEADAARWYDAMAREHYGEFACTNRDIYGDY